MCPSTGARTSDRRREPSRKRPGLLRESWYTNFFTSGDRWSPAHTDQHERVRDHGNPVVSLLMPIGTFHHATAQNVMKVNVSESYFLEPLTRIHLAKNSTIFLLNEQGSPILSQQAHELGTEALSEIDRIRNGPLKSGVVYLTNDEGAGHSGLQEAGAHRLDAGWTSAGKGAVLLSSQASEHDSGGYGRSDPGLPVCRRMALLWRHQAFNASGAGDEAGAPRSIRPGRVRAASRQNVKSEVSYVISTFRYMVSRLRQRYPERIRAEAARQQAEYKAPPCRSIPTSCLTPWSW